MNLVISTLYNRIHRSNCVIDRMYNTTAFYYTFRTEYDRYVQMRMFFVPYENGEFKLTLVDIDETDFSILWVH